MGAPNHHTPLPMLPRGGVQGAAVQGAAVQGAAV